MRCQACNCELNDFESTRKSAVTEEYLDLCDHCLSYISDDFEVIERDDLRGSVDVNSYEEEKNEN